MIYLHLIQKNLAVYCRVLDSSLEAYWARESCTGTLYLSSLQLHHGRRRNSLLEYHNSYTHRQQLHDRVDDLNMIIKFLSHFQCHSPFTILLFVSAIAQYAGCFNGIWTPSNASLLVFSVLRKFHWASNLRYVFVSHLYRICQQGLSSILSCRFLALVILEFRMPQTSSFAVARLI